MTTKQYTIPIEGIPDGWEPVAYRIPVKGDNYHTYGNEVLTCSSSQCAPFLILQKTKPREITLVETDEDTEIQVTQYFYDLNGRAVELLIRGNKIWRIKDEQ